MVQGMGAACLTPVCSQPFKEHPFIFVFAVNKEARILLFSFWYSLFGNWRICLKSDFCCLMQAQ